MSKIGLFFIFSFVFLVSECYSQQKIIRPQLVRGPYLQSASSNSIIIRWRTNVLTRSRVKYGAKQDSLNRKVDDSSLVLDHAIKLTGLSPNTKYYYSIGEFRDSLQGNENNYFYTLPTIGQIGLYRIGVFGDCGNSSPNQIKIRDQFSKYLGSDYMNAWILLGDNAYNTGTDFEYQTNFFDIYKDDFLKKYPLFPAPGNHDYYDMSLSSRFAVNELPYYKNFSMPINGEAGGVPSHTPSFYSFDIGNIHFISLDSYGRYEKTLMYDTLGIQSQWLKKDLEANRNKGWIIAYWHHPPYTMGSHNSDKERDLVRIREEFIRMLERYDVDLVLCGHSHVYERSRLMNGYYGMEADFNAKEHNLDSSSAYYDGSANSCPYIKSDDQTKGIVYVVSGSAGSLGGKQATYPHNAMYYSNITEGGALMLEVQDNRLDLKWICSDGQIRDRFTMMKNVSRQTKIKAKKGQTLTLTASYIGKYRWNNSSLTTKSITVTPKVGKTNYMVEDEFGCFKEVFQVETTKR